MSILLGFEIPSGRRVEIPDEGHAAFFGQTQLSGKTTLIEAIVDRAPASMRAIAFITKRGEGSFIKAKPIPPYFSEPTNDPEQPLWRWVSAILEASQQRKLRFEEAWIIRACEEPKQAKSLADVHANIRALIDGESYFIKKGKKQVKKWDRKPVTGINQGVYTSLKAYFDIVMPQLQRMPYTKTLELRPGLNVMDLREYSMEAQSMVIRSVIEYVSRKERNTRVIVPEAQDFVPQGRNSPVKMACESLVRKGAADKNFMWLDSQDMAAVDKVMLRAVSILGCGVQGEAHEMGRAIAHLFGVTTKLTPRDIGSLKVGQFYIRLAGGDVTKVYVQPAWMDSEVHAKAIAMGQEPVSSARQILKKFKDEMADAEPPQMLQIMEQTPNEEEKDTAVDAAAESGDPAHSDSGDSRNPTGDVQDIGDSYQHDRVAAVAAGSTRGEDGTERDETMQNETVNEALSRKIVNLQWAVSHLFTCPVRGSSCAACADIPKVLSDISAAVTGANTGIVERTEGNGAGNGAKTPNPALTTWDTTGRPSSVAFHQLTAAGFDSLYRRIKETAQNDPGILELLASRPEIRVTTQRQVIEMDDTTLAGKCARLIADGFFKKPTEIIATVRELRVRGSDQPTTNVRRILKKLNEQGFLLSPGEDIYQAVEGMKINIVEQK